MEFVDHATIAGLFGVLITVLKVVEKTVDHFVDKRKSRQPTILQLDPDASRLLTEMHAIVSKEDPDGGHRIYVPLRTINQVEQIHRKIVNGHIKD